MRSGCGGGEDDEEKEEEEGTAEVQGGIVIGIEVEEEEEIGIVVVDGIFINKEAEEEDEEEDVEYVSASSSLLNRSNALLKSYPLTNIHNIIYGK